MKNNLYLAESKSWVPISGDPSGTPSPGAVSGPMAHNLFQINIISNLQLKSEKKIIL